MVHAIAVRALFAFETALVGMREAEALLRRALAAERRRKADGGEQLEVGAFAPTASSRASDAVIAITRGTEGEGANADWTQLICCGGLRSEAAVVVDAVCCKEGDGWVLSDTAVEGAAYRTIQAERFGARCALTCCRTRAFVARESDCPAFEGVKRSVRRRQVKALSS